MFIELYLKKCSCDLDRFCSIGSHTRSATSAQYKAYLFAQRHLQVSSVEILTSCLPYYQLITLYRIIHTFRLSNLKHALMMTQQ